MTTTIATTLVQPKYPKKKVGIFDLIEPGQNPDPILYPMVEVRDHAVAQVQHGSSWLKLHWEPEPSMMSDRCPERINELATAYLNQTSTFLLKGPLPLTDKVVVYGPAFLHYRTMLMPYQRIRRGITVPEAEERIGRMLLGWGCVSWDNQGPIVICNDKNDLFGAKLAVG
jgi:hypothetical protein